MIKETPYTAELLKLYWDSNERITDILHLLPNNRDHVEFLTQIYKDLHKGLDLYYEENIFICKRCKQKSVLHRYCPAGKNFEKCIKPKIVN